MASGSCASSATTRPPGGADRSNLAPLQVSARPRLASGPSSKDEWGTDTETVGEFLQQAWRPSKEGRVETSTLDQYVWAVNRHIVPLLGAVRLRDLTAEVIDRWISTLTAPDAEGKPRLGSTSARLCRKILSMGLQEAVERGANAA